MQVVHTHASVLSTKPYNFVQVKGRCCPTAGKVNRESAVALAVHDKPVCFVVLCISTTQITRLEKTVLN